MKREPFEVVAKSPESGAAIAFYRECKMFASNNFRKPPHCCARVHLDISIREQPVVYQLLDGYNHPHITHNENIDSENVLDGNFDDLARMVNGPCDSINE